jgi:SAM-dependent methyltransferase
MNKTFSTEKNQVIIQAITLAFVFLIFLRQNSQIYSVPDERSPPSLRTKHFNGQTSENTKAVDWRDANKEDCEITYWKKQKKDNTPLGNSWYKRWYTRVFKIDYSEFAQKKILDIGCGPRGSLEWAHNAALRVCIDPLSKQYGLLGANEHSMLYIETGVEDIPIPDNTFDYVFSINNFDHITSYKSGISEIHRVLNKGGTFGIIVEIHPKPTSCEPISFEWNITKEFEINGMELVFEKHTETCEQGSGTSSVELCLPFDHSDKTERDGFLLAVFKKK